MTGKLNNLDRQQNSDWPTDSLTIDAARIAVIFSFAACDTLHKSAWVDASLTGTPSLGSHLSHASDIAEDGTDQVDLKADMGHGQPANHMSVFALQWRSKRGFWQKVQPLPLLH